MRKYNDRKDEWTVRHRVHRPPVFMKGNRDCRLSICPLKGRDRNKYDAHFLLLLQLELKPDYDFTIVGHSRKRWNHMVHWKYANRSIMKNIFNSYFTFIILFIDIILTYECVRETLLKIHHQLHYNMTTKWQTFTGKYHIYSIIYLSTST